MGLFSKILGGSNGDKSPLDMLKNAAENALNEVEKAAETVQKSFAENGTSFRETAQSEPVRRDPQPKAYGSPWNLIPAEENQYNFNGTWLQYFDKVFREDFPAYSVQQEPGRDSRSPLFVFYQNGIKRLVIEMKSERSSSQAIRRRCEAEGMPYLRFYYDHDGWWNVRSYVTGRVRAALGESRTDA